MGYKRVGSHGVCGHVRLEPRARAMHNVEEVCELVHAQPVEVAVDEWVGAHVGQTLGALVHLNRPDVVPVGYESRQGGSKTSQMLYWRVADARSARGVLWGGARVVREVERTAASGAQSASRRLLRRRASPVGSHTDAGHG
jgi:hypothetical protein